jgi:hypothetical protein
VSKAINYPRTIPGGLKVTTAEPGSALAALWPRAVRFPRLCSGGAALHRPSRAGFHAVIFAMNSPTARTVSPPVPADESVHRPASFSRTLSRRFSRSFDMRRGISRETPFARLRPPQAAR